MYLDILIYVHEYIPPVYIYTHIYIHIYVYIYIYIESLLGWNWSKVEEILGGPQVAPAAAPSPRTAPRGPCTWGAGHWCGPLQVHRQMRLGIGIANMENMFVDIHIYIYLYRYMFFYISIFIYIYIDIDIYK